MLGYALAGSIGAWRWFSAPLEALERRASRCTAEFRKALLRAAENAEAIALYRAGKTKLLGMFVGQVMKRSEGRANPQKVSATVKALLEPPP